jgi:hypothetical protein
VFGLSSPETRKFQQRPPDLFLCKAERLYQAVFNTYSAETRIL